jgi:hypothetical protein
MQLSPFALALSGISPRLRHPRTTRRGMTVTSGVPAIPGVAQSLLLPSRTGCEFRGSLRRLWPA